MNYFLDVIQNKYAQFSGRATRSEYWYFTLFYLIAYIVAVIIDGVLIGLIGFPILTLVVAFGLLVPAVAVGVRRLHDINKSGWWMLLSIVPLISLVLIAFFVMDSKDDNEYGKSPKL